MDSEEVSSSFIIAIQIHRFQYRQTFIHGGYPFAKL